MGNKQRFALILLLCSAAGVIFGATTSQAALQECLTSNNPSNKCLTQDPVLNQVEGMGMGLFVGIGAALGATWNLWRRQI